MLGAIECVRSCLVNGHRNRLGRGIGFEAGVNGKCFKFHNEFLAKTVLDECRVCFNWNSVLKHSKTFWFKVRVTIF